MPVLQAKNLFLKGIEHERGRKFYEAIQFYKRAVQLVPDIEVRLYESTKTKVRDKFDADDSLGTLDNDFSTTTDSENHNEADEEETDLFSKLSKIVNRNQCVCFPKFEQNVSISLFAAIFLTFYTSQINDFLINIFLNIYFYLSHCVLIIFMCGTFLY